MKKIILIILLFISNIGFSQLIPEYQYDSIRIDNKLNEYNTKINTSKTTIIIGAMFVYVGINQHIINQHIFFKNDDLMRNINNIMIVGGLMTSTLGYVLMCTYVNRKHDFKVSVGYNNLSLLINF